MEKNRIIIFDTETNGLPKNWKAPAGDVDNWPRILQIAWQHCTLEGKTIAEHSYVIKTDVELDPGAQKVHGLTKERLDKEGVSIEYALSMLEKSMEISTKLVAHNISFDKKIVQAEMIRAGRELVVLPMMHEMEKICTMHGSTKYCNIPGPRGVKWPKLTELHQKLFNEGFEDAHDALGDVTATARCYFELKKLGVICG